MKRAMLILALFFTGSIAYGQTVVPVVSGVATINIATASSSSFKINVTGVVTVNVTNQPTSVAAQITILFSQDGTGHAVTFGTAFNSGSAPSVSTTANSNSSYVFQYDGTSNSWFGVSGSGDSSGGFTAGNDLSGSSTSQTVVGVEGAPIPASAALLGTNLSKQLVAESGAPPNGTAGGQLSGSYPNPGLASTITPAAINSPSIDSVVWVDGTTYTTIEAAYAALPSTGGTVMVPPNFTETPAGNITLGTSYTSIHFTGPATINFGTHQLIVSPGTAGLRIFSDLPFGNAGYLAGNKGVVFNYTGNSNAIQWGGTSALTYGISIRDITVNLLGSGNAASCVYVTRTLEGDITNLYAPGNENGSSTSRCIVLDGSGDFTGFIQIVNPQLNGFNVGIQFTGDGTYSANSNQVFGGNINSGAGTASKGVDFEDVVDSNVVVGTDVEGTTGGAFFFGGHSSYNDVRGRTEGNTYELGQSTTSTENVLHIVNGLYPVTVTGSNSANSYDIAARSMFHAGGTYTALYNTVYMENGPAFDVGAQFSVAGCGTATSLVGGTASGTFHTASTACAPVVTMTNSTAPDGWNCFMTDHTTPADFTKSFNSSSSQTTATWPSQTVVSGDVMAFSCTAY